MLNIKNLSLQYGEHTIFNNINLKLDRGEVLLLTGHSGSGKSSLLRVLNGIIPEIDEAKLSGDITLHDKTLLTQDISTRSRFVSTVFQNPKTQFYCENSTDELAFALENRNIPKENILRIIDEYTTLLNTKHLMDKNIFSLSGGEKQLIAITGVACMDNEIYLFDEPSSSLDQNSMVLLREAVLKLKNAGKIIIIAEHRLSYLREVFDKIAILNDGQLHTYDMSGDKDLRDNIVKQYQLRSLESINKRDLKICDIKQVPLLPHQCSGNSTAEDILPENAVLECKNFEVSYAGRTILNLSISFPHDICFIIGRNGVGKTTFIKKLAKLIKGRGESFYKGRKIDKSYNFISMVMQDVNYQIFTESVWQEISIVSDNEEKKTSTLKELGLYDKKDMHPQLLSGGEKQRLMIALAKVSDKPIVIFDEPTSGLCKKQMLQIVSYLKQMKSDGKLVLVITHDYELIYECGGTIYEFM